MKNTCNLEVIDDRIDIPVRQVMIEARIVIANNNFRKELGVRIAGDAAESSNSGRNKYEFTGRLDGLTNNSGEGPEGLRGIDCFEQGFEGLGHRDLRVSGGSM